MIAEQQLQQSLIAARLRIRELEARVLELQEQLGRATAGLKPETGAAFDKKRARELARETKLKRKK